MRRTLTGLGRWLAAGALACAVLAPIAATAATAAAAAAAATAAPAPACKWADWDAFRQHLMSADGRVIGIDMTEAMAERARAAARALRFAHVEVRTGDALDLPVDSESADFVISNGVLNLASDKRQAFGEVFRILKPAGQFLYADIVVADELSESIRRDIDLWTG